MLRNIIIQVSMLVFGVIGGVAGMFVLSVALCWFFGGAERVTKFLTSTTSNGWGIIEWIGSIIGLTLGFSLGVILWIIIMKKTGWISESEIIKFLGKK